MNKKELEAALAAEKEKNQALEQEIEALKNKSDEQRAQEDQDTIDALKAEVDTLQSENLQLNESLAVQEMQAESPQPVVKVGSDKLEFTTANFVFGGKKYEAKAIAKAPGEFEDLIEQIAQKDAEGNLKFGILRLPVEVSEKEKK